MFRILAGVLTIGQVEVDTNEKEEAFVRDEDVLKRVAVCIFSISLSKSQVFCLQQSKGEQPNLKS